MFQQEIIGMSPS